MFFMVLVGLVEGVLVIYFNICGVLFDVCGYVVVFKYKEVY